MKIERWCIIRKYDENPDNQFVKIEKSFATNILLDKLSDAPEEFLENCESDELSWWRTGEEMEPVSLSDFMEMLKTYQAFPESKSADELVIEEGMVFVYIVNRRMIHFTYQARKLSEIIYDELLGKGESKETSEEV